MKKVLSLVVVLLFALTLSACNQEDSKKLKVGFIYIGHVKDGGWTLSHDEGRKFIESELDVETMYVEGVKEGPEVKDRMNELIEHGCNVIIANSFGYMEYVKEIADKHPEVKFLHCSGYMTAENMGNYFGRVYEARYLTGIVAGLKTKVNKIGYVAAFPIAEVVRGINAFTLGVRSVNPEATVEVKWTETWYNPEEEKHAAEALLDQGVDVIAQHQDTTAPQIAAQEHGKWSVGYHTDMNDAAPEAHLVSAIWNWGPYYVSQVKAIQEGTWKAGSYWGGLADGVVDITDLSKNAPEGAEATVTEVYNKIKNGEFKVFEGPIKDQDGKVVVAEGVVVSDEDLLLMNYFVEGVIGTIPEEE